MIKYIYNIIKSDNPNLIILKTLLLIAIIYLFIYLYKISAPPNQEKEGFTQSEPFVFKQDKEIYDDFYAEVYEGINNREKICQKELFEVIKMTEPTTRNSVFLDIGSGTGSTVNELNNAGYKAYGVDSSESMVEYAETKYPKLSITCADVKDPMLFEKSIFTHLLCTDFTIYHFQDKNAFFKNCYYWLKGNGYLVLHLVDKNKFAMKKFEDNISKMPEFKQIREMETEANFEDYKYKAKCEFVKDSKQVLFKEYFVDKATSHIRENEQTYYMEEINDILDLAKRSGFILHGKVDMRDCNGDKNQYLYVLERTL